MELLKTNQAIRIIPDIGLIGMSNEPHRTDFEALKEVIKEFLSKYRYLYEIRVQKLVYYGELYCLENYGRRLTSAEFKPYMYGSFSEDVRKALRELDLPTERTYKNGSETVKYLSYGVSSGEISDEKAEIISRIHQLTKNKSTDELAQMSKDSWLYENEEFDEPMNFERYKEEFDLPREEGEGLYDEDAPGETSRREEYSDELVSVGNVQAEQATS